MKKILPFLIAALLLTGWSCRKDLGLGSSEQESDFWSYTLKKSSQVSVKNDSTSQSMIPTAISDLKNRKDSDKFQKYVEKLARYIGIKRWNFLTWMELKRY